MAVDFGRTKLSRFDDDELINKINIMRLYCAMIVLYSQDLHEWFPILNTMRVTQRNNNWVERWVGTRHCLEYC